jgi:hypothetical protein
MTLSSTSRMFRELNSFKYRKNKKDNCNMAAYSTINPSSVEETSE